MNWLAFAAAWAVTMALDAGFMPALSVGGTVPQAWPVLLAFICLHATRDAAMWAALAIGAWLDATHPSPVPSGGIPAAVHVLGPNMLACAAGAWGVLELRALLYRRNLAALVFGSLACSWLASLAFVALAGIRSAYADPAPLWGSGSGAAAVGGDLLAGLLSVAVGIVPATVLQWTFRWWSFAGAGARFGIAGRPGASAR